jgi:hypothetical protein
MLLNEVQKHHRLLDEQQRKNGVQKKTIAAGVEDPRPRGQPGRDRRAMSLEREGVLFKVSNCDLAVRLVLQQAVVFRAVLEECDVLVYKT